ncbi:MAG: NAD(P)H-binding protein [Bacteroidota bacterium]
MRISIVGCGWLGLPLAKAALKSGFTVKGTTTTEDKIPLLHALGIDTYLLTLSAEQEIGMEYDSLFDIDALIVNVPPGGRNPEAAADYPKKMNQLRAAAERMGVSKVVFVSSTSVYPQESKIFTEEMARTLSEVGSTRIFKAEEVWRNQPEFNTVILRCGGLIGGRRIPGKYFSGKTIDTGEMPVNYIHREDIVALILFILSNDISSLTLNAVSPYHPTRREVYLKNADIFGFDPPVFEDNAKSISRVVSSVKLVEEFGFSFLYPDPLYYDYDGKST